MEQDSKKNTDSNKDTNAAEGSSKPEQRNRDTPRSLKANSKIIKKSKAGKFKGPTNKGSQQIGGRKRIRKNKKVVGSSDELPKEKGEKTEIKEKESQNRSTNDKDPDEKSHRAGKNKIIKADDSAEKQKNKEKCREFGKGGRSRINKTKHAGMENADSSEKKREKLGGFIFMCSAKTKPDCFRYCVMGVSVSKKDIVLNIKPGTKLFLYDFDLKLLYGIYKASSSGGMKLEPRAFGGNFPAQVRFNVASDCYPLPESIFKKAIKDNYNEKNKFKTELNTRQVRKLTELFRPVDIRSALQPVHVHPHPIATTHDRDAPDGVRGSWSHVHRERPDGEPYSNSNMLSHERETRREEIHRDLFLTEKSYRAYGLQGGRRNVTPPSQYNPLVDPFEIEHHRDVESLHGDPLHLNESEHQTYFRHGHVDDPYHAYHYGASPRDPYLPPLSREEIPSSSYLVGGRTLIGNDNLQRRDRLYSTYSAADALSEYNRIQHYQGESSEPLPVSSRYSFSGPSYSFR